VTEAARWLEGLGASRDVVSYAETVEGDRAAFWASCPRGDWLLAIGLRAITPSDERARRALIDAARAIAALGLDYVPEDDTLSRKLLTDDDGAAPSRDEVDALERDADDAPDPAVSLARRAIVLSARARLTAEPSDVADLAMVPALVSQAAAHDAGDCAMIAAASFVLRRSAELVRAHMPAPPG
jgi:hypothetical protein